MKSYDAGPTGTPILEQTIGVNFEHIAGTYPDVDALVDVFQGLRLTYAELNAEIEPVLRIKIWLGRFRCRQIYRAHDAACVKVE